MTVGERAELERDLAGLRADLERNQHYQELNGREMVRLNHARIRLVLEREIGRCVSLLKETA